MGDALDGLLATLVEDARNEALRAGADPERKTPCHFCGDEVALWETLLVRNLTGVPAHIECPDRALQTKLRALGPVGEFPYEEFSKAVDERLQDTWPTKVAGIIKC